jgi:hypothetical protein
MYGELASVQGIVDLSPQEALDRAEGFLASQGYIIGQRTYTTIAAQRRILGRHNRPIQEKNLKLFRFVTKRLEPTGLFEDGEPRFPPGEEWMIEDELIAHGAFEKRPTGHELVREWDAQPWVQANQWTYDGDTRTFWRDYNQTRRRLSYSAPPLR